MGSFFHRHSGVTLYLLLLPGIAWLAIFFLVPLVFLGYQSLESGSYGNFQFTWEFSNFTNAFSDYREQLVRSFFYAGLATVASLLHQASRSPHPRSPTACRSSATTSRRASSTPRRS